MGEMAEYILNGDDCQVCGVYIGSGDGFPRTCAGCQPRKARKAPKSFGKKSGAFVESIGAKVVHRMNPTTKRSFCQFENNWVRGNSLAFNGEPPLHYFDKREESHKKDCKNCATLHQQSQAATP